MTRNNRNFKHLCRALRLRSDEIVEIVGGTVSKSTAAAWQRGSGATQPGVGICAGRDIKRNKIMSDDEFDSFCERLIAWMRDEPDRAPDASLDP